MNEKRARKWKGTDIHSSILIFKWGTGALLVYLDLLNRRNDHNTHCIDEAGMGGVGGGV